MVKIALTIFEVGIIVVPLALGLYFLFRSGTSYSESFDNSKLRFWGVSKKGYTFLFRMLGVFCLSVAIFALYNNYFAPDEKVESEIKDFWKEIESTQEKGVFTGAMLLGAAIAIPTRMGSTRFPGKPLAMLGGKTVLQRVYERCLESKLSEKAVILTDSPEIIDYAKTINAPAIMTSPTCNSGTERIIEAFDEIGAEFVVNVQGDEPFISPELIDGLIQMRKQTNCDLVTAASKIQDVQTLTNENVVKVLRAEGGRAIYFSRAAIPHIRGETNYTKWLECTDYWRHIGIYGYSKEALERYANFGACNLEKCEMLEQLRFVSNGMSFEVVSTEYESIGIDTPADLAAAEEFLKRQS